MADLTRIKNNVAKMVAQNAPESDIDGYIKSEGTTIDAVKAFKLEKPNSFSQTMQNRGAEAFLLDKGQPKSNWSLSNLGESIKRGNKQAALGAIQFVAPNYLPDEMAQQAKELEQQGKGTGATGLVGELMGNPANWAMGLGEVGLAGRALQGAITSAIQPVTGATPEARQSERDVNTKVGAASYALAPEVLGLASKGIKKLGGNIVNKIGDIVRTPEKKAQNIVLQALEADKLTPQSVASRLSSAQKINPQTIAQDIVEKKIGDVPINPSVSKQVGEYSSLAGGENVAPKIANRMDMQNRRIEALFDNTFSQKGSYELGKAATQRQQQIANTLRNQAMAYPKNIKAPDITEVLNNTNIGQKLFKEVYDVFQAKGKPIGASDASGKISNFNTDFLDAVKKVADTRGQAKYSPTASSDDKAVADFYEGFAKRVKEAVIKENPVYAEYLSKYGDEIRNKQALENGKEFLKLSTDELKDTFGKLSNPEKQHYLSGVKEQLMKGIQNTKSGSDQISKFLTPKMRDNLSVLFPKKQNAEKFFQNLALEKRMFDTDKAFSTRGTNKNLLVKNDSAIKTITSAVANAINFQPANVGQNITLRLMAKNLESKLAHIDEKTSKEIVNIMYSKDPAKFTNLQKILDAKNIPPSQFHKAVIQASKGVKDFVGRGIYTKVLPESAPTYNTNNQEN